MKKERLPAEEGVHDLPFGNTADWLVRPVPWLCGPLSRAGCLYRGFLYAPRSDFRYFRSSLLYGVQRHVTRPQNRQLVEAGLPDKSPNLATDRRGIGGEAANQETGTTADGRSISRILRANAEERGTRVGGEFRR